MPESPARNTGAHVVYAELKRRILTLELKPGERIVINGLQRVRPGMKVTPALAPMALDSTVKTAAR